MKNRHDFILFVGWWFCSKVKQSSGVQTDGTFGPGVGRGVLSIGTQVSVLELGTALTKSATNSLYFSLLKKKFLNYFSFKIKNWKKM